MGKFRLPAKLLAAALSAALLLPGWAWAYTDTSGHWAESAINKWSGEYGILQGYDDGTFRPDSTITRGAFAGIMARFLRYQAEADPETFSDTSGDYWESAILKLNAAGVYLGSAGKALIYSNITRQQAVTMIGRAFGLQEESADLLTYADRGAVQSYAKGYLAAMAARGYITDTKADNRFRPADDITRAEVVSILSNMIQTLYQNTGTYSNNVAGSVMVSAESGVTLQNAAIDGDLIIAPGVTGTVTLKNVTLNGMIRNLGSGKVTTVAADPDTTNPGTTDPGTDSGQYITYNGKQYPIYPSLEKSNLTADNLVWSDYARRRLSCESDTYRARQGVDVSTFQGDIDWQAVAADGIEFAVIRCGGRGTSNGALYQDSRFVKNIDGAAAAGLETGVYFFAQAISVAEAEEEADYVLSLLKDHTVTGMVVYDWEILGSSDRTYGVDAATATACARAFCQKIEAAGYRAGFYFTEYVGYAKYDLTQLTEYDTWFANYSYKYPHFYYQVNYWQYSSSGTVNGMKGRVDMDLQFVKK